MPQKLLEPLRVTIPAGDSLFWAGSAHAEMNGLEKVHHIFPNLFDRLEIIRHEEEMGATAKLVFVAAVDLNSDRQGGMLQKAKEAAPAGATAVIDAVDYRDYYPEPWGIVGRDRDKDGLEEASREEQPRVQPSLSPRLNFLLGGFAAGLRPSAAGRNAGASAHILVVAHHFELKDSLLELRRRDANVAIAFYRSLMSPRWERFGLYREDSPIKFLDLDPYLEEITTLGNRRSSFSTSAAHTAASQLF